MNILHRNIQDIIRSRRNINFLILANNIQNRDINNNCNKTQLRNSINCSNHIYINKLNSIKQYQYFLPNKSYASQTQFEASTSLHTEVEENNGLFKKIIKKIGFADNSKSRLRAVSYFLYEFVADNLNYKEFFDQFKLPNTFNSWFMVTELHVWMLLIRAMAEGSEKGEDGRVIRNFIVEAMWADVNTRAKKLTPDNPSGTRSQIYDLSQQFQAALIAYDEGLMGDDRILAGALWHRFFQCDCDNYEDLEKLVKYIRSQILILDSLNRKDFIIKPNIKWLSIKDI